VHLLNAGHMPPILLRGDRIENLVPVAPVLGFLPDAAYMEQEADLEPGDYLVVYSDGVTEARNGKDEFFGEERLRALLPPLRASPRKSSANGSWPRSGASSGRSARATTCPW